MDGDGSPVGSEAFRCAPGPMGWRYVADIRTRLPSPREGTVDLVVDGAWRPARVRIATGEHEVVLTRQGDRLSGTRDGLPVELAFAPGAHLDHPSPAFNAVTAMRLSGTAEIDVVCLAAVTLEPRPERQRYEDLGDEEVATPAGRFAARRWRFTALSTGWSRDLWIASDLTIRYDGVYELEWYEAGASGPRPLP